MATTLAKQIESVRQRASQLEAEMLKGAQRESFTIDVGDVAADIARIFDEIGEQVTDWRDTAARGKHSKASAVLRAETIWLKLYVDLEAVARVTVRLVKSVEAEGSRLPGRKAFKRTVDRLRSITCFSPESVRAGFTSIAAGKGMGDDEVFASVQAHLFGNDKRSAEKASAK